jgi:hypothetical protein
MGGAVNHQRSSSPLKRRASDLDDEPSTNLKNDIEMQAPISPESLDSDQHLETAVDDEPSLPMTWEAQRKEEASRAKPAAIATDMNGDDVEGDKSDAASQAGMANSGEIHDGMLIHLSGHTYYR